MLKKDADEDPSFVLRLTLVLILLHGPVDWYVALPSQLIAVAMLVRPDWLGLRPAWAMLALLLGEGVAINWATSDNHQYLIFYWVLAVTLALHTSRPATYLRQVSAALVAVTFLLAAAWKIVGGEFLDGIFWEAAILADDRLRVASQVVGGLDVHQVAENASRVEGFMDPLSGAGQIQLLSTPQITAMALVMGWFGFAVEACIGVLFLIPRQLLDERIRVSAVAVFLATVYFWLPVVGFAWIIGILTMASLAPRRAATRELLFVLMLLLLMVSTPKDFVFAPLL